MIADNSFRAQLGYPHSERPSSPLAFGMMRLGLLSFASRVQGLVDRRYFFVGE